MPIVWASGAAVRAVAEAHGWEWAADEQPEEGALSGE